MNKTSFSTHTHRQHHHGRFSLCCQRHHTISFGGYVSFSLFVCLDIVPSLSLCVCEVCFVRWHSLAGSFCIVFVLVAALRIPVTHRSSFGCLQLKPHHCNKPMPCHCIISLSHFSLSSSFISLSLSFLLSVSTFSLFSLELLSPLSHFFFAVFFPSVLCSKH